MAYLWALDAGSTLDSAYGDCIDAYGDCMIIRLRHVSDFGLIGGNLSNFLTAVTPRHPGRAGLSNCAKIAPN